MDSVKQDLIAIQETREGGASGSPDADKAPFRESDLADHQATLAAAGALVDQLPTPGAHVDADVHAPSRVLRELAEDAQRACIGELVRQLETYGEFERKDLRGRLAEVGWWIDQEDRFVKLAKANGEAF
jgi:hypothetical protein